MARVFGILFYNVLFRGSQHRVESMLLRLCRSDDYLLHALSPQQVRNQPAMECVPLVMEPRSGLYTDPVVVLDFRSLYPSIMIAYNLWWVQMRVACECVDVVVWPVRAWPSSHRDRTCAEPVFHIVRSACTISCPKVLVSLSAVPLW